MKLVRKIELLVSSIIFPFENYSLRLHILPTLPFPRMTTDIHVSRNWSRYNHSSQSSVADSHAHSRIIQYFINCVNMRSETIAVQSKEMEYLSDKILIQHKLNRNAAITITYCKQQFPKSPLCVKLLFTLFRVVILDFSRLAGIRIECISPLKFLIISLRSYFKTSSSKRA